MNNTSWVDRFDSTLQKTFEILPGLLIWLLLLAPIWLGLAFPYVLFNAMIILSLFWVYRATIFSIGSIYGLIKYHRQKKIDWLKECMKLDRNKLPDPETLPKNSILPNHLIVIANYGEDYDVLSRTIRGIIKQNYPKEKIFLSVSIEERKAKKDKEYAKRGEYLKRDFGDHFGDRLMFFVHPENIPGEAIGAASNRTWGTKKAVEVLEKRGYDINEFLVSAPDGDILISRNYLADLSHKWLLAKDRNKKFYQTAMYTFNNNYWDIPIMIRILSISLTIPVLASSIIEKRKRETHSLFTMNLGVMKAVNYWDTSLGIDDTPFYWRPFDYFNGEWWCEVFFSPLHADGVYNDNYFKNHIDQYKQYVRWGWGVVTIPIAFKVMLKNKKISIWKKIYKTYILLEKFVLFKVIAFLLSFTIPIVVIINPKVNELVLATSAREMVSVFMTLAILFLVPSSIVKLYLLPERPKDMSFLKFSLLFFLEIPLSYVVYLSYGFLPFIDATTRMMLGQKHAKAITWSEKKIAE
jgi:hypothetical protein